MKMVALGHHFKFAFDQAGTRINDQYRSVRQRHVASGFPITDRLGLLDSARTPFPAARCPPQQNVRCGRKAIAYKPADVIAIDSPHHAARTQRKNKRSAKAPVPAVAPAGCDARLIEKNPLRTSARASAEVTAFLARAIEMSRLQDSMKPQAAGYCTAQSFRLQHSCKRRNLRRNSPSRNTFNHDQLPVIDWGRSRPGVRVKNIATLLVCGVIRGSSGAGADAVLSQ